jgi:hypothetical protein
MAASVASASAVRRIEIVRKDMQGSPRGIRQECRDTCGGKGDRIAPAGVRKA